MKTIALLALLTLTSCVTTETTITSPDGTVTVIKSTAPDAASVQAGLSGAAIAAQVIDSK